ncbi:MAG: GntR family transcriptional regulator [Paenibacillus sp.]|nr:GntR family transcriptional regulator [Paenibacillus sp.]
MPAEKGLAARFELSNKSVRKGLEALEEEGLILKIPRVGNQVRSQLPRVTIRFGISQSIWRDLRLRHLIEDFNRIYPHIEVKTISYSRILPEAARTDGNGFDLITSNIHQFQDMIATGIVDHLERLPEPPETHPFLLEPFRHEGGLYVQPLVFGPVVLCYNKTHFAERGIPEPDGSWTWNQLMHSASALSNGAGRYGFGFYAMSDNRWPLFFLQSGNRYEWERPWEHEALRRKLAQNMRICKDMLHDRTMSPLYFSENDKEINQLFMEGKISMMLASYTQMNDFIEASPDYDISPVPFQHDPATLLISIGVCMNRHSLHPEEAGLFLRFMASQRAQEIIQANTLSIPSFRPLMERPVPDVVKKPRRYALFREMMFTFRSHRDLQLSNALSQSLLRCIKEYWADMLDEQQLCDQIFQAIRDDREHSGKQEPHPYS